MGKKNNGGKIETEQSNVQGPRPLLRVLPLPLSIYPRLNPSPRLPNLLPVSFYDLRQAFNLGSSSQVAAPFMSKSS